MCGSSVHDGKPGAYASWVPQLAHHGASPGAMRRDIRPDGTLAEQRGQAGDQQRLQGLELESFSQLASPSSSAFGIAGSAFAQLQGRALLQGVSAGAGGDVEGTISVGPAQVGGKMDPAPGELADCNS